MYTALTKNVKQTILVISPIGGLSQIIFYLEDKSKYMPKGIPRDTSTKRALLHRMKIARGHIDRVIHMVEKGEYCIDVIHQSMAVQSALKSIDQTILKDHMETCVAHEIRKGNTKEAIEEIMKVMGKK